MDEKKELLRQIGWSDELIEKCLSGKALPATTLFNTASPVRSFVEHDITDLNVNPSTPLITDGTHLRC